MQASMKARRHKLGISRMSRSSSPVCGSLLQSAQTSPSASVWTKALATRNCISLETQIGYLLLASHDSMLCRSYDQPVLPRMTGSFMITCRSRTVHFGSNHKHANKVESSDVSRRSIPIKAFEPSKEGSGNRPAELVF